MTKVATVTASKISRVIRALSQNGRSVARIELQPDGRVVITPSTVDMTSPSPANDLDNWRATRAIRPS